MIVISQDRCSGVLLLPWMWRRLGRLPAACHMLPGAHALKRSGLVSVVVTVILGGASVLSTPVAGPVPWLAVAGGMALVVQLIHLGWIVALCGHRVHLNAGIDAIGRPLNADERTAFVTFVLSLLFAFGLLSDGDPMHAPLWIAAIVGVLLLMVLPALGGGHADRHPLLGARADPPVH